MNDDFGVEIYDPTAQGSDLSESSMFHNPEVIAHNVDESLKELEKDKKKPKKSKKGGLRI